MSSASRPHRQGDRTRSALNIYYCLCGEFALVCDRPLSTLPVRPLDQSRVLRCLDSPPYSTTGAPQKVRPARVCKISAQQAPSKLIRRSDGTLEKQYPYECARCHLQLGYEHTPPPLKSGGRFTFVLPGALTDRQGVAPPDAFLEELLSSMLDASHDAQPHSAKRGQRID
ncbi:uncharacterized protein PAN0_006d3060 [Moesziomyces antarcticus]|uniref:Uncharacterized protein n=2 Tax=Pseudozyma antarctica TaxID=84753 RepID=A0A5C3FNT1_PSEA2|nr:uncharacterized protein PAN0_006d3060 [Moesziomyces antarcticus]GAK64845.1 conserved hypothetical protein [Moesziomyces antarcticus]SPO45840.1 uncharacterized protein PSANT_03526 [Moesziomyces antarcticus]